MKPYFYKAKVISVYDGDTMTVDIDLGFGVWLRKQKLRLAGINTPEIRTRDLGEKVRGYAARDYVRKVVAEYDHQLWINTLGKGKYGRWIADIYLYVNEEGLLLNKDLVKKGFAVYKEY